MHAVGLSTSILNDSTYIFVIDTLQWQTFERIYVKTSEPSPIKIQWGAYSKTKPHYYYGGITYEAQLVNENSYTDRQSEANTVLSIYKGMQNDTVMVIAGYNDGKKVYLDYKYFIILMKN
jgi:hypothetical protein